MVVTGLCCEILQRYELNGQAAANERILHLLQATLNPIRQLFSKSDNEALLQFGIDGTIVAQLVRPVVLQSRLLQSCFLDTLLLILKAKITIRRSGQAAAETTSEDSILETRTKLNNMSPRSSTSKLPELDRAPVGQTAAPQQLLNCLLKGVVNPSCQALLQKWIQLVCESTCLHALSSFSTLMKIVECFCKQIEVCFDGVRVQYQRQSPVGNNFEFPLFHLLNGLDFVLAQAHEQLLSEEETSSTTKSPEPQQGFFGSLVSGTTTSEAKPVLRNRNNNRLTVILCFQDALRICFQLWSWQSLDTTESSDTVASFQHTSQKVRTRSRRILEHLLAAEPLESMETLADIWMKANSENDVVKAAFLLNLVNTLEGTRPRITVGAIFNAISIRTYPSALMLSYRATLSSNLQEIDLLTFVNSYVQSLEDDVLDEIWKDCTTFLREVFNNPMAHRQILIQLVDFIAILSAKIENTNFGEEWKMRRELADLFVRLLTAIFTIKPQNSPREKISRSSTQAVSSSSVDSVEHVLDRNFATFSHLLGESDRLVGVMVNVVSNVIAPVLRSRQFPQNLNSSILGLLVSISRIPNSSKAWKKELTDAFNDAKFFSMMPIDSQAWLPLIHQLVVAEKDVLPELLFRFSAPTAAGIMFNIGVTAARLEADKKAQINLRRVASVLLAVGSDTFATHLGLLQAKLEELLTASYTSSPSSATRADVYMVLRALVLKSSSFGQMATFWPMLNAELRAAFTSIETDDDVPLANTYNEYSLLQAAKLLDVLLLTNREDFQPQEWLFVTDTVDAIYRPEDWDSSALIDEVGRSMMENSTADATVSATHPPLFTNAPPSSSSNEHQNLRKPWLSGEQTRSVPKADIQDVLLRPFFGQLSIHIYERTYSLDEPDMEACKVDLWADLFDERTIVGA